MIPNGLNSALEPMLEGKKAMGTFNEVKSMGAFNEVPDAGILGMGKPDPQINWSVEQLEVLKDRQQQLFGNLQKTFDLLDGARKKLAAEKMQVAQRGEISPEEAMKAFAAGMAAKFMGARDKYIQGASQQFLETRNQQLDQQYLQDTQMNQEDFRQRTAQGVAGIQSIQDQAKLIQSTIDETSQELDNVYRQLVTQANNDARLAMNDADNESRERMNTENNERLLKQAELELEQSREVTKRMTDQNAAKELNDYYDLTYDSLKGLGTSIGVPNLPLVFITSVAKLVEGGMDKEEAITAVAEALDEKYGDYPVVQKSGSVEPQEQIVTEDVLFQLSEDASKIEEEIAGVEQDIKEVEKMLANPKSSGVTLQDLDALKAKLRKLRNNKITADAVFQEAQRRYKAQIKKGTEPVGVTFNLPPGTRSGTGPTPTGRIG